MHHPPEASVVFLTATMMGGCPDISKEAACRPGSGRAARLPESSSPDRERGRVRSLPPRVCVRRDGDGSWRHLAGKVSLSRVDGARGRTGTGPREHDSADIAG